jgi:hypothetical protein
MRAELPILSETKKRRYITYRGKRYVLQSESSTPEILRNINVILKTILKKRKKRKATKRLGVTNASNPILLANSANNLQKKVELENLILQNKRLKASDPKAESKTETKPEEKKETLLDERPAKGFARLIRHEGEPITMSEEDALRKLKAEERAEEKTKEAEEAKVKTEEERVKRAVAEKVVQLKSLSKTQLDNLVRKHTDYTKRKLLSKLNAIEYLQDELGDKIAQIGAGFADDGLFNTQIDQMMKQVPGFLGTYAIDQISNIKIPNNKHFSFIMNTQPFPKDGHWVAVIVSPSTIEYFDPFGEEPSKRFYREMKKILPSSIYQNKINRIKQQLDTTNTCGFHAMKFIAERQKGRSWKGVSGFETIDKSKKGEKDLKPFISKIKRYGYIKV